MTSSYPDWMLDYPEPQEERRKLSGYVMEGWLGMVPLETIQYWVKNRRTDVQATRLRDRIHRVPTDDDLYNELIGDPDLDIERLAKDILKNGLRHSIIISADKTLLDGNRRYLAHRWIIQHAQPHERDQFRRVQAWVLKPEFSNERDIVRVVTEYNFLDDFRREWSDYVKAKLLWEEYNNSKTGYTYDDLVEIYGGPGFRRGKIVEFIKTYEIIMEFVNSSPDPDEAVMIAADSFIWFQQLQRSYRDLIRNDDEFQEVVFDNIRKGYIGKTDDLKWLKQVRDINDAWALFKRGDIESSHLLRKNVEQERKKQPDPNATMAKINAYLEQLLAIEGLVEKSSPETLVRFHELAEQVPGQISDVNRRISYIIRKFQTTTSSELASLSEKSISSLEEAVSQLINQAQATRD